MNQAFSGFFLKTYFRIDRGDKSSPSKSGGPNPGTDDCYVEANYGTGAYSVKGTSGTMTAITDSSYTVGSPLMFFASNASGTSIADNIAANKVGNNGACAIYWFQLYDSSTNLIHNLMPAERDSDGKAGFFDTVTRKFYAQSANSTGNFEKTPRSATGQGRKWTGLGADNLMSNPANWEGDTVPADGEDLDFTSVPPATEIVADIGGSHGVWVDDVLDLTFTGYTGQSALTFKGGTAKFTGGDCNTENARIVIDGGSLDVNGTLRTANVAGANDVVNVVNGKLSTASSKNMVVGQYGTASMTVGEGGRVVSGSSLYVGNNNGSDGTLTVNGGSVGMSADLVVAQYAGSKGTLNVNGGTVTVPTSHNLNIGAGSATINLNGGTLVTRRIFKGNGSCTIVFNGGTLKANEAPNLNGGLLPGGTVRVGAGGGTIDCGGLNIKISVALGQSGDTGGLNFTGGNGNTIAVANYAFNYTGVTSVAPGTTLSVNQYAAKSNILARGLVVSGVPEVGQTIFVLTRGGGYTIAESELAGVSCPVAPETEFELVDATNIVVKTVGALLPGWYIGPADGDLSVAANWSDGAVPGPGTNAVISCKAPATLTTGATFAPSSITFAPGSASVTINGDDITGIVAVTNLSSISHIINAKVYFTGDIQVSQPAMGGDADLALPHVTFAGGAYVAEGFALENEHGSDPVYSRCVFGEYFLANDSSTPWTVTASTAGNGKRRNAVADNSILHIPYAGALGTIYVGDGAKVYVENWTTPDGLRLSYRNYGEIIADNLTLTGSSDSYATHGHGTESSSVFKFRSVVNSKTGTNRFRMGDADGDARQGYWIGEDGLTFSGSTGQYIIGRDSTGNYATIRPWNSDFTIAGHGDSNIGLFLLGNIEFNTDDENGVGREITLDGVTVGRTKTVLTVSGKGTLKVNKGNKNDSGNPTVILADKATLEYTTATANLGAASITLGGGTTFAFQNSGNVLTLPAPIALPSTGAATLRIDGARLRGGKHTIATGVAADAADYLVVDPASAALAGRKMTLAVEDGNLVLNISPKGLMVIVK